MSGDRRTANGGRHPAPDARATAAVIEALLRRATAEQPFRRRGDEFDLIEYVLSAWNQVEIEDAMHLQALTLLVVAFLPPLVLTELAEKSADLAYLASLDPQFAQTILQRSGVASWCDGQGYPLQLGTEQPSVSGAPTKPLSPDEALAVVREGTAPPTPTDELEAHEVLDRVAREALPRAEDVLESVQAEQELSARERIDLRLASLKLLATCRLAGAVVLPAIAWGEPDLGGLESWWAYLFSSILVALNLRLLADASSAAEQSALLHFDDEILEMLAEGLDRPSSDLG